MRQPGYQRSKTETGVGLAILLCVGVIASGVLIKQYRLNPAVLVAHDAGQPSEAGEQRANQGMTAIPPDLKEFGVPENFTPDNLYNKIDGKAELYLSAGFVQLHCQRFALRDAPNQWLEWFVYDMGSLPQAFSVFSTQRRTEGQPLDLTEYAYQTQNALYFVCGSNYIEAIASSSSKSLMRALLALARRCVAANPAAPTRLPQLELLPTEGLVPGSYVLQCSDAFGFDQFKNVFAAQYKVKDTEVMAFVTSCGSADAAVALCNAYRSFLIANGGKELGTPTDPGLGKAIEIMGRMEIVFGEGNFVAGIHAAPALAPAEQVAGRLRERLAPKAG